jgi:glycerol kinase
MAPQFAAALDQGTTGTRFMIFRQDGTLIAADYLEHRQITPRPGWVEHDPMEIWEKSQQVIAGAMRAANLQAADLAGIGITNQRETTVVWERRTGRPVMNAIVWQDTRTQDICQHLIDQGMEAMISRKTGLKAATYFSGPKLQWIMDNVPGVRSAAENGEVLFGTMDTWLIWWLCGGPDGGAHVTDVTNASRTMLMDLRHLEWDGELLEVLRIPRAILPKIRPSSDRTAYGMTHEDGPLGGAVPVCGDLGDQQAALFGQTCFAPGEAKNTYGTGNFLLLNTGSAPVVSKSGLLTTAAYSLRTLHPHPPPQGGRDIPTIEVRYALEGSIAVTGAAIQWLRDNLKLIRDAAETEAIGRSVEDSGGVYFVPAFSGLFAPYWDMYARGVIVGLTRYATRAHLVRAALEAICYQTREVAEAMVRDSGTPLTSLKVDGGAVRNDFLMQLQADILGIEVVRPMVNETTALGAAYAAGLATGLWANLGDLRKNWRVDRAFQPQWSSDRREAAMDGWRKAVARARAWVDRPGQSTEAHA